VNDLHQFQVEFFNAAGVPVASPAQTLTLLIDNAAPNLQILAISYKGAAVTPCRSSTSRAAGAVVIQIEAFDSPGDLYTYDLTAYYGQNQSVPINSAGYPGGDWQAPPA